MIFQNLCCFVCLCVGGNAKRMNAYFKINLNLSFGMGKVYDFSKSLLFCVCRGGECKTNECLF